MARGERTCAQAPRAALCVGPEMAHCLVGTGPGSREWRRRTRTDTKGECVGLLPPRAALDARGDSGESWALWRSLRRPPGNRPGIYSARRVGEGEPIGIPELLPRQPFGH